MSKKLGFIGLGIMGLSMARNLLKTGSEVTVWNRSPGREAELPAMDLPLHRVPKLLVRALRFFLSVSLTARR